MRFVISFLSREVPAARAAREDRPARADRIAVREIAFRERLVDDNLAGRFRALLAREAAPPSQGNPERAKEIA